MLLVSMLIIGDVVWDYLRRLYGGLDHRVEGLVWLLMVIHRYQVLEDVDDDKEMQCI